MERISYYCWKINEFFFQPTFEYDDFISYFQIMATLFLACIIIIEADKRPFVKKLEEADKGSDTKKKIEESSSLQKFLSLNCKELMIEKANNYNGLIEVFENNIKLGKLDSIKYNNVVNIDIKNLEKDADEILPFENEVFSGKCICSFLYCLLILLIAPIAVKHDFFYYLLFVFTTILFLHLFFLRSCLQLVITEKKRIFLMSKLRKKNKIFLLLRFVIKHILAFLILSIVFCLIFDIDYQFFKKNIFIFVPIFFSCWCFIYQFFIMMKRVPKHLLKKHGMNEKRLKKLISATQTLINDQIDSKPKLNIE